MFELPSLWNLTVSTIVFFIAAWYIRRYLEDHGIPKGVTRGLLVFVIATSVSCGAGDMVDWTQEKIQGPKPAAQAPADLSHLLKQLGDTQP